MAEQGSFNLDFCKLEGCHLADGVLSETLACLARLGIKRCPGLAAEDTHAICSLPGELAEVVMADQCDAPEDVVVDASWAVVEGRLNPERLPVGDAFFYQMGPAARWLIIEQALPKKQVT